MFVWLPLIWDIIKGEGGYDSYGPPQMKAEPISAGREREMTIFDGIA